MSDGEVQRDAPLFCKLVARLPFAFFLAFVLSRGANGLGLLPFTLPDAALFAAFILGTLAGPALASIVVTAVTLPL